ncbi:MAG: hypothetical protein HY891_00700 [Deltaproteobacteria bacterium]|nr:hypothetical protein [Deltaproteobacteria bacterium]
MRAKTFISTMTALFVITASGAIAGQAANTGDNHKAAPGSSAPAAAGTYTVAQVYAKKSELKGRVVKVHGNVVKVLKNIMGRTWVHIQDGTGSEGGNKIVFTSKNEAPEVGSAVIAQGTLETDKDFGYGYFYSVIVEDATFSK